MAPTTCGQSRDRSRGCRQMSLEYNLRAQNGMRQLTIYLEADQAVRRLPRVDFGIICLLTVSSAYIRFITATQTTYVWANVAFILSYDVYSLLDLHEGSHGDDSGAYVGRVGGLAVALGIGAAIATGQGVAWADSSGSSSEPPGSSASPEHSPSSSDAAAGAPAAASAGTAVERKRLSVPSVRPWGGQGHRKAVVGRDGSRLTRKLSTDDDTTPEERPASAPERTEEPLDTTAATPGPETGTPASGESTASHQAADEPAVTPAVDEEPTVAGDPAVTPEGPSETSDGAADISDATVLRSSLSSRQSTANTLERRRSHHELASVPRTGGQTVDIGTVAEAPIDAVASAEAQIPASAMPFATSLSTTVVDRQPVIARAAPAAAEEPSIITRLLAPLGIGALATRYPSRTGIADDR